MRRWAKGKTWQQIYDECDKGEWLLWLLERSNKRDKKLSTLVLGHCANTVRHLMENQRSRDVVDAAIAYGEGKMSEKKLADARVAAWAAARDASSVAARAAAWAASCDASSAVSAAAWAAAWDAAWDVSRFTSWADACAANQKQTADIVRKYIPIHKFNIR